MTNRTDNRDDNVHIKLVSSNFISSIAHMIKNINTFLTYIYFPQFVRFLSSYFLQ